MNLSTEEKRGLIEWYHSGISVSRQCELLSLSKGALYYEPIEVSRYNLELMDLIDQEYMKRPFYGSRKMTAYLRSMKYLVSRQRVQRLMRLMGIAAIYPRPNLSRRMMEHKIYPYLLKGMVINRPNLVWSTDITYIRVGSGFVYLTAIIDWFSRYVLSWRLSNSLEVGFCVEALLASLEKGAPEIFNTDQGSQFTSDDFLGPLKERGIKISMDSKGRALDNIFVERLWRSVKYEEVYIKDYQKVSDARESLKRYFNFYNDERFHESLEYRTPREIYYGAK